MADRTGIETLLREIYDARLRGDLDAMMRGFDPAAEFEIRGANSASPIPMRTVGVDNIREHLAELVRAFTFETHDILSFLVEDQRVVAHCRLQVKSNINGETAVTETADFIEFKDGRIVSFVQFIDTALAAKLATK